MSRGAKLYARAVEISDSLPPREQPVPGARLDVILVHERSKHCEHYGMSHDHRILSVGVGAPVLGHRTRVILLDVQALMAILMDDAYHGRASRQWVAHSLACRLEPDGYWVLA